MLASLAAWPAPARAAPAPPPFLRWGEYVPWDAASLDSLRAHLNDLDVVASHTASLGADGSLDDKTDPAVKQVLAGFGGRALLEVTNGGFDQDVAHALLTDPQARAQALASLAAVGAPWKGISLDFEDLDPADRDAYSAFVRDLKARLGPGRTLALALPAQTHDVRDGWAGGYDYAALGQAADYLFVMGYAFRSGRSDNNGPVDPLPWLRDVLGWSTQRIPPARLVLGVAAYGYDWRTDPPASDASAADASADPRGTSVTYSSAITLQQQYHVAAPSYDHDRSGAYFQYQDADGTPHEVWYEDRGTFAQKLALVGQYHLAGIGWWRLGGEDPGVWSVLASAGQDGHSSPESSYAITNPQLRDFYTRRGDVAFFGYPISNEFTLQGSRTQIFQRAVLQIGPDGHARLMNLLDPDVLPLVHVNGSTLPAPDWGFMQGGPAPGAPDFGAAAPAWVKRVTPDTWDGLSVGFGHAFFSTVSCQAAFPDGDCQAGLLPLMALELWGLPTSAPARDPANKNFVYQRFQRGIMHYDASTGTTQGLLLGEVFKSVLTGQNLPADVAQEQRGSRFYRQYDPTRPNAVARPDELPATDLRGAF